MIVVTLPDGWPLAGRQIPGSVKVLSPVFWPRQGVRPGAIKLSAFCTDRARFAPKTATRQVA